MEQNACSISSWVYGLSCSSKGKSVLSQLIVELWYKVSLTQYCANLGDFTVRISFHAINYNHNSTINCDNKLFQIYSNIYIIIALTLHQSCSSWFFAILKHRKVCRTDVIPSKFDTSATMMIQGFLFYFFSNNFSLDKKRRSLFLCIIVQNNVLYCLKVTLSIYRLSVFLGHSVVKRSWKKLQFWRYNRALHVVLVGKNHLLPLQSRKLGSNCIKSIYFLQPEQHKQRKR